MIAPVRLPIPGILLRILVFLFEIRMMVNMVVDINKMFDVGI
jgi:hypothetical protein